MEKSDFDSFKQDILGAIQGIESNLQGQIDNISDKINQENGASIAQSPKAVPHSDNAYVSPVDLQEEFRLISDSVSKYDNTMCSLFGDNYQTFIRSRGK